MDRNVAVNRREVIGVVRIHIFEPLHGARATRIDAKCRDVVLRLMISHTPVKNRVRATGIVPPEADHVRQLNVVVASRRCVRTQGFEITGHSGGHAHTGIGLDGVGADDSLHEEILQILTFHSQLPRAIQADGVAAGFFDNLDGAVGDQFFHFMPARFAEVLRIVRTFGL